MLLRQAWREGQRSRKKTLANLSKLPPEVIDGFRTVLQGGLAVRDAAELLSIERSWAHGHVAAVLGTCRQLGLERIVQRRSCGIIAWLMPCWPPLVFSTPRPP